MFRSIFCLLPLFFALSSAEAHLFQLPGIDDDTNVAQYQIGSQWGKLPVDLNVLTHANPVFKRAALATAFITNGGTAFYLGKFNGAHLIATNHHVCPMGAVCLGMGNAANFKFIGKSYDLVNFIGTMPEVDLSIIQINVPAADEGLLKTIAQSFSFKKRVAQNEPLLTIGFGIGNNPTRQMMANQDSDCKVISKTGEYYLMADPDTISPVDYKAWSFANGCDVSHGDSGSAMIDRNTGDIMGIIWTGKTPKSAKIQNSAYVQSLMLHPNSDVWSELSLAVPAEKMPAAILNYIKTYAFITPEKTQDLLHLLSGVSE